MLAFVMLALFPAAALAAESQIEITDLDVKRYAPDGAAGGPEFTQAGAHPNVNIYMQFCGEGLQVLGATNTSPIRITTEPHGLTPGTFLVTPSRVIGVNGNLAANGAFPFVRVVSPTEIEPFGSTGSGEYTGGGELFLAQSTNADGVSTSYGCTPSTGGGQQGAYLKDFTLKLPPGFLGNPNSVPACPTHLWLAGSCPDNTQLGHATADTAPNGILFLVTTSVFNLQTLGWEPARLGTEVVPGIPPGPLPNSVTLRSAPDPLETQEPNQQRDVDEVQTITINGGPTGGTFRLTFNGRGTAPIPFDGTAAAVQAALEALPAIETGNVAVTGPAGGPYTVRFVGGLSATNVRTVGGSAAGLTGGSAVSVSAETIAEGENRYQGDDGDYGINSYQINIPKELGGNLGKVRAIDIALCAYAPCRETLRNVATSVVPNPSVSPDGKAHPFFVNPTSCDTDVVRLEARSYSVPDELQSINITTTPGSTRPQSGTFTLTFNGETTAPIPLNAPGSEIQAALEALPSIGTGNVQVVGLPASATADGIFTARFVGALAATDVPEMTGSGAGLTPPGRVVVVTSNNGQPQKESREDFREAPLPVTGCENVPFDLEVNVDPADESPGASDRQVISLDYPDGYAEDEIWQSQLKDADTNLPPGMGLAPGGGVGLKECSYEQFGVSAGPGNRQLNNDPVRCPEGSHVGDIEVETPVLQAPIGGKAFFGPTGAPGRPTDANPWKLFLLLEGQGVRVKLVGDVTLSPTGQVRTVFLNNPETPFTHFRLKMGTRERAVLMNPITCGPHEGNAPLKGYSGAEKVSRFSLAPTPCNPDTPFDVKIDEASANPEQAGAHSVSHIVISRPDGNEMLKGLKLSLPPGAAGSLSAVAKCPLGAAQAGNCPESTLVGNIKTTLGSSESLFTVPGKLYLAEPAQPGDVASIVATVPAKAGVPDPQTGKYPIDLGPDVVIVNRLLLREADTGVDVILQGAYRGGQLVSDGIPDLLEGVGLPIRKIEITVDREGFFLNPTGCDPRTLTGTFTSVSGKTAVSSMNLQATGCDKLPFDPTLYMIAGERGKTKAGQNVHPPLTAIVTQKTGEAAISRARVLLPNILRPNVPFLNEPGALCNDAQAQARTCPAKSLVGSARVITPVLPFELNGPVHIVQEIGNILPKLYVYLRGGGFEVLLRARNRITGVRTENTFDFVPDVPQSYFELKINGGDDGLLNNFYDLCDTPADSARRQVDATFNGHNGAVRTSKFPLRVEGCGSTLAAARISTNRITVNRKGTAKVKVNCRRKDATCRGRLAVRGKGISAAKSFRIPKRKTRTLTLKFSKGEVKKLRKAKRKQMKGQATTRVTGAPAGRRAVTLVYKR